MFGDSPGRSSLPLLFTHVLVLARALTSVADRHLILHTGRAQKSQKVDNLFSRPKKAGGKRYDPTDRRCLPPWM